MLYFAYAGIYILGIFFMHIIPLPGSFLSDNTVLSIRLDYLLHTLVFVPFMGFCWLYLRQREIAGHARFLYIAGWFLIGIFLAVMFEFVHYFLPYRTFNPIEILFNITGVILGMFIFLWRTDS